MKCQFCGAENIRSRGPCRVCGKPLGDVGEGFRSDKNQMPAPTRITRSAYKTGSLTTEEISRAMRAEYAQWSKDGTQKVISGIQELLTVARSDRLDLAKLYEKSLEIAHQQFRFRWLTLGTKGRDGLYRYDSFVGLREDAIKARKRETFRREDFGGTGKYFGRKISDQTTIYLEEDKPYTNGAEETFNRPALIHAQRHAPDDSLEADFVEVHIYGGNDDLVGWIEASGTTAGKLPSVDSIKWLEVIASIIGVALSRQRKV